MGIMIILIVLTLASTAVTIVLRKKKTIIPLLITLFSWVSIAFTGVSILGVQTELSKSDIQKERVYIEYCMRNGLDYIGDLERFNDNVERYEKHGKDFWVGWFINQNWEGIEKL